MPRTRTTSTNNGIEIDRGGEYYTYQKINTEFCIDGGNGGADRQDVFLWACNATNRNQHWQKVPVGGGAFKLIKRNASEFALNGGNGGANTQNINLHASSATSQNLHWIISPIGATVALQAGLQNSIDQTQVSMYPNPVATTMNVQLPTEGEEVVLSVVRFDR